MSSLFASIQRDPATRERFWLVAEYARKHFKEGGTALEVGCSDGGFAVGLCMVGYNVVALDPEAIPYLAQLYTFKKVTLKDWYTVHKTERFDMVHLGEVIEHVEDPDEMMRQACHVCSGKMIVSAPDFMHPGHLRVYTKDQFVKFVEQYMNFENVYEIKSEVITGKRWLVMGEPKERRV